MRYYRAMICGIVRVTLIKRLSSTADPTCKAPYPFSVPMLKDLTLNRGSCYFGKLDVCRVFCWRYRRLYPTLSCAGRTNTSQNERPSCSKREHAWCIELSFWTWLFTQKFLKDHRCFVSIPRYPRSVYGFERL